ncbi:MAG: helix-turn-helix domain-containing protein [Limisphaerales bacterium]
MKISGHLRIEEFKLLPGQEWIDESDAWRFCRVSAGAAYWLETAHPRALSEGEMLVLPPRLKGVVRASQINDVLLHAFNFVPEMLCGFLTLAERRFFENRSSGGTLEPQFLSQSHPLAQRLASVVIGSPELAGLRERIELLNVAAAFFNAEELLPRLLASGPMTAQVRFTRLMSEITETDIEQQTTDELAHACGCSPRHFNRLFRDHFGESLRARRSNLRLLRARQLLLETDKRVAEIASEVGYSSLSLFNALFKRRYGASPSGFRRVGRVISPVQGDSDTAGGGFKTTGQQGIA